MIRPDSIPLIEEASHAVLSADAVAALFGKGYRLRGNERVRVGAGDSAIELSVTPGDEIRVTMDRIDAARAGRGALRLVGPRGSIDAPPAELLRRRLILQDGLRRAWRLETGQQVAIQASDLIFTDVVIAPGNATGVVLDRADRLAAGLSPGDTVSLRRDLEPADRKPADAPPTTIKRLITENDVRQARLRGNRIVVQPGQIITPAARSLGRELGVLDLPPQ